MTFEETRVKYLQKLDDCYTEIRNIVSDPGWNNEMYPRYIEAVSRMVDMIEAIKNLNSMEMEAKK